MNIPVLQSPMEPRLKYLLSNIVSDMKTDKFSFRMYYLGTDHKFIGAVHPDSLWPEKLYKLTYSGTIVKISSRVDSDLDSCEFLLHIVDLAVVNAEKFNGDMSGRGKPADNFIEWCSQTALQHLAQRRYIDVNSCKDCSLQDVEVESNRNLRCLRSLALWSCCRHWSWISTTTPHISSKSLQKSHSTRVQREVKWCILSQHMTMILVQTVS